MNQGLSTHTIYTDFSKAFDMVNHGILIDKLKQCGVKGSALDWLKSYLTDRLLQVRVNGYISELYEATSGVPQGSHLGPILFNIFINDIGEHFKSEYQLYADDLKIFRKINSDDDIDILQRDINTLYSWCQKNNLNLNKNKCVVLSRLANPPPATYYLNEHQLSEVSSIKDLGIIIDNKFNFSCHVDRITSHAFKTVGFLFRAGKEFKDVYTLIHIFKTLVRPTLEYGCIIWSPHTQQMIDRIEKIQRKFCKFLTYYMYTRGTHLTTDEVYRHFKIDSLFNRCRAADLTFFYKSIQGQIQCPEISNQFEFIESRPGLRTRRLLTTMKTTKNYIYHGPKNRIANMVNEYIADIDFFVRSLSSFNSNVKKIILTS